MTELQFNTVVELLQAGFVAVLFGIGYIGGLQP